MNVNNESEENMSKLKGEAIEQSTTKPDTLNNCNFGYNNLNSVLKNVDDDRVINYIKIKKTETAKFEDNNNRIKEINNSNDNSKNEKICLNTNIKKNNKQNIDLYFLPKRVDRFGTPITRGGKHKVTFIDRITKSSFTEVIKIESYKEFNKMEEVSNNRKNYCCFLL